MSGPSDAALAPTLVVDFGTSAARAAVVTDGTSWLVPEPASGSPNWPAAAHWDGERLVVGTLAERLRAYDPEGYWSDLKRGLTVDVAVARGRRRFRPIDHVTELLAAIAEEARRRLGAPIDRALLTVPASYPPGDPRRARMIEAAEAAGLRRVELLVEPVAAVSAAPLRAGALALVYDLGAGSFDAALVRAGADPHLIASATMETAGGRDIDSLLAERIHVDGREWLAPLLARAAENPGSPDAVRLGIAFDAFTRRIKHGLSEARVVRDRLTPHTPTYELTRADFELLLTRLLAGTVACCDQLLRAAKVSPRALDAVVLTGGGARIPAVARQVAHAFGRQPYRLGEPELTTVYGASRWLGRCWHRSVPAEDLPPGSVPLTFPIPGGRAQLVRWLVAPGDRYGAGAPLARVRIGSGALWDLTAAAPGTVDRLLVEAGAEVASDQWLALAVQ